MSGVTLRPIFAMMIALAMLFAPFAMPREAMAAVPSDHHAQSIADKHCGDPSDAKGSKAAGKSCCVAMCAAVALASVAPPQPQRFDRIAGRPSLVSFTHGYLAELATPPPRGA